MTKKVQESNLLVPSAEEGTELSEGTGQDTQMNEMPDEGISVHNATPPHHHNAPPLCKKFLLVITNSGHFVNVVVRMTWILLIHASWNTCSNKLRQTYQTQTGNICSLLPDMKTMNDKQKRMFIIGVV
jgi:hypothetical protein